MDNYDQTNKQKTMKNRRRTPKVLLHGEQISFFEICREMLVD